MMKSTSEKLAAELLALSAEKRQATESYLIADAMLKARSM